MAETGTADGQTQFCLQRIESRVGPLALVTIDNGEIRVEVS